MIGLKKLGAMLMASGLVLTLFPLRAELAASDLIMKKFDLGGKGTAPGYIGVSASDKYDPQTGYGFYDTKLTENVEALGQGALSDAVRFGGGNGHLRVDLPSGVYKITVTTGNVKSTTIVAEGIQQLYFLTGNNAVDSITIPVTDGQLNIYATSGVGSEFSLASVDIEQTSSDTKTKPVIWVCGDSTVASYYNVDEDSKRGWGQYLPDHIDTGKYDVRNISASGLRSGDLKRSLFPTVEHYGKSGDILLLSVGINDYIDALKADKDHPDPSSYVANMTDMIRSAKAKGVKVYLVKQQGELDDCTRYPPLEEKWFSSEIDLMAAAEGTGVIDMFRPWLEFCMEKNKAIAGKYYNNALHPNAYGADLLAGIVSEQLFPSGKTSGPVKFDPYPDFDTSAAVRYQSEASGLPVKNPHKGYVMTLYNPDMLYSGRHPYGIDGSNGNRAWDVVTICSGVMFWEDLNSADGVFDFEEIDKALEACEQAGMTYGIRIIPYTTSKGSDDNYGEEHDFVPQWVYDKGAKRDTVTYRYRENAPEIKVPNWSDPIYIKAYKDLIKALADRYNGDPRVEYLEIRAFGNMGEWHTGEFIGNELPSVEIQKDMVAYIASVFTETTCSVFSDAREIYDYAVSLGLAKRNNGMIMAPNTEWDLRPAYRANVITMADNHNTYRNMLKQDGKTYLKWTPERYRECIETAHLSIFALDQDGAASFDFYREQQPLIDEMCNRLGYNFTVTSAMRNDNTLKVTIKNTGLAPAFFNIDLCAELTDADGNRLQAFGSPVRIGKGTFRDGDERSYIFEYDGSLPSDATICLALYDADNTLAAGKDPTVRFDNVNVLQNNRMKLVAEKVGSGPTVTPVPSISAVPTKAETPVLPTGSPIDDPARVPTKAPAKAPTKVPSAPPQAPSTKPSATSAPSYTPEGKTTPAPDLGGHISEFISRLYRFVLNRAPENGGLDFWTDELYSFRRTGAEVGLQFIFSEEFTSRGLTDEDYVTVLYRTFFGREPEEEGFKFWTSALTNGSMDRASVAYGFVYSKEWADTCASYGIRSGGSVAPSVTITPSDATIAFVERMYTTALARKSDPSGLDFWSGELSNFNVTGESVGAFFFLSDEMNGLGLSGQEFVTRLYKTFMNREPEEGGFKFWTGFLNDGGSRAEVVYGFTRSEEFVAKCIEARIMPY